jgi:predicted DNA-binding transcriptional regulator AlpA
MGGSVLILTRREAAGLLGISPSTFDNWVRKGIAPSPISGTKRWSKAAIERAMSGAAQETPANTNDPEAIFEAWERENAPSPKRHQ